MGVSCFRHLKIFAESKKFLSKFFPKLCPKLYRWQIPTADKTIVDRFSVNEFLHQLYWRFNQCHLKIISSSMLVINCSLNILLLFLFITVIVIVINFNLFLIFISYLLFFLRPVLYSVCFLFRLFLGLECVFSVWFYDVKTQFCLIYSVFPFTLFLKYFYFRWTYFR